MLKIESDTNRQSLTCSTKPCERKFSIVSTNNRKTSKTVVVPSKKNYFFNSLINVLFYALILIETCVSSDSALNSASDDILRLIFKCSIGSIVLIEICKLEACRLSMYQTEFFPFYILKFSALNSELVIFRDRYLSPKTTSSLVSDENLRIQKEKIQSGTY